MFALALAFALQVPQHDTSLARAESLLVAGALPAARRIVEPLTWAHPDNPRVLTLMGRIWLAWPVFGRWQADSLFTRAGDLDPDDPEPFYYLGLVGVALRGDDGEWVSRRGLTRALAIDPLFLDTWPRWLALYRGPEERRAGVAALARHAGRYAPDLWRAQLLVERGEYAAAESLLTDLSRRAPDDPAPYALLAQSLFEWDRDVDGVRAYEAALARAAADTGGVLWRQVRSAASPGEREAYPRTGPEERAVFFRVFWAHRRPGLRAATNGRIGEHFRRWREARRRYALLHPNSSTLHSRLARAMPVASDSASQTGVECLRGVLGTGSAVVAPPAPEQRPANPDETMNLEDGLDDRGRIFVRYGAPDEVVPCGLSAVTWRYRVPEGFLQVSFVRRTGPTSESGDPLVTPLFTGEWAAARWLLATDRPSVPATLRPVFWTAQFRSAEGHQTDLLVLTDSVSAVAALTGSDGREIARDSATNGPLHFAVPPGRYLLAIDATRGGTAGQVRGAATVRSFAAASLAVSSLLLTTSNVGPERAAMAAAAPGNLRLPTGRPLRLYAEVYGLAARGGYARFDVEYSVERLGGAAPPARPGLSRRPGVEDLTTFRFRRERPAQSSTVESLVIDPGRLPGGRYRLRLVVTDALGGARSASDPLEFELR